MALGSRAWARPSGVPERGHDARARGLGLVLATLLAGLPITAAASPPGETAGAPAVPASTPPGVGSPTVPPPETDTGPETATGSETPPTPYRRPRATPEPREIVVSGEAPDNDHRDASVVTRREMQERLPRSAPDALRYEPGVFVQQSAHAQASPYVRGLTGQQTLIAFDGIRLNTSTFRQGPNQYFFTVDSRSIARLEVVRGSASTKWGSDALGGALLTTPIDPTLGRRTPEHPGPGGSRWIVHPKLQLGTRSADGEVGGRAQIDLGWGGKIGLFGGVGYRHVGQLETAGPVLSPATGQPWREPRFAHDERTQLGTGFRELTADTRLVWQANSHARITAAYYDYRQKDAPRTDRCPPAEAPQSECLVYLDQFRTLTYLALDLEDGPIAASRTRVSLSYQKQHERTQLTRDNGIPEIDGGTESNGRDDVHTIGLRTALSTSTIDLGPRMAIAVEYGAEAYLDLVQSLAWIDFTDLDPTITRILDRGQYIDGSRYLNSGAWVQPQLWIGRRVRLRGGGRVAFVYARSDGDEASETAAVDRSWTTAVGNLGVMVLATDWLSWHLDLDQGFRAPNLDDLTSRQQTGPGFQFENARLDPERALSLDTGFRVRHAKVEASLFFWQTFIRQLIARAPRETDECPEESIDDPSGCASSRTRFQLVNLDGWALLRGIDASARVFIPHGFVLGTTLSWAWGEGQNPLPPPSGDVVANSYRSRLPLSRVPPINGSVEFSWYADVGLWLGTALRWAAPQTRLALSDEADQRIPTGGTPGFAVVDLRAGYRFDPFVLISAVLENLIDSPYRYHGSSVNGAARSISLSVEFGF